MVVMGILFKLQMIGINPHSIQYSIAAKDHSLWSQKGPHLSPSSCCPSLNLFSHL